MRNIDINQIKHLYHHEKKSGYEIAEIFDCSVGTIYNKMKQHGLPLRSISEAHNNRFGRDPKVPLDITEIVRLYFEERLSLAGVGERMGASGTTIREKLLKAGHTLRTPYEIAHLGVRPSKFTEADVSEMERLYVQEELPLQKVAERFNCPAVTVGNKLKERGIRLRTAREAQALYYRKQEGVEKSVKEETQVEKCTKVGKCTKVEETPLSNFRTSELPNSQTSPETYTPPKRLGKVFEPIPLIPPEEVTLERILILRQGDDLTLDDIAAVCSLSRVEVFNILMKIGGL